MTAEHPLPDLPLLERRILQANGLDDGQIAALVEAGVTDRAAFATIGDAATLRQLLPAVSVQTAEDVIQLFGADVVSAFNTNDFNGSGGDPKWVGNADIHLKQGDFTYSWFIDYIGPTDNEPFFPKDIDYFGRPGRLINSTDPWLAHTVSVRWMGDQLTLTGGIANIFDAQPPVISEGGGQRLQNYMLAATQYDMRGRTFFVRAGYKF